MGEMSDQLKVFAPRWIWLTLLAPLAFLAWCGWMFVVVQESHREDAGRAIAVEKLESLERALLELQQGSIVLWRTPIASDSLERWRELYRNYRGQVKRLEGKDPAIREVMDYLVRLYAAVGRTERIRQQLLATKVPEEEAKALEAEFRAKIDVALAELKTAMLKLRTANATSDKLPLWTGFAIGSAVLALIVAGLLLILGRQMGRVAGAETELAANWRDVRAVESHWQTILNAAPDAFLVADEQGVVRAANLGAQNLIGHTVSDLAGRPLSAVLPALARVLGPDRPIVALVKPQFEAGRGEVGKGGVVRDPGKRLAAIARVLDWAHQQGFRVEGEIDSPIAGPRGNLERLTLLYTPS